MSIELITRNDTLSLTSSSKEPEAAAPMLKKRQKRIDPASCELFEKHPNIVKISNLSSQLTALSIELTSPSLLDRGEIINTSNSIIFSPSNLSLQILCWKYFEKYKAPILLVNSWAALPPLLEKLKSFPDRYFGIILNPEASHVSPIIVKNNEILFLDTIAKHENLEILSRSLKDASLEYLITPSIKSRQIDFYSCRTGAVTLLRNALIYLQTFTSKESPLSSFIQDGELPPEWDYSEQVSNKSSAVAAATICRSLYSKKPEKQRAPPSLIVEFKDRFIQTTHLELKIYLQSPPVLPLQLKKIVFSGDSAPYILSATKSTLSCSYLLKKGKRNIDWIHSNWGLIELERDQWSSLNSYVISQS